MAADPSSCPYCAETIKLDAVKCRFCGEFLDEELRLERLSEMRVNTSFNPGLAAVLSILGTGFGQLYQMRVTAALCFMAAMAFFVTIGLTVKATFLLAAAVIHLTNIWEAYLWRPDAGELFAEESIPPIQQQAVQLE